MKRTFRFLILAVILISSITITASAASFTPLADDLKAIGVLSGTGNGYELDREATRIEAAAMFVRLLGEDENAAAAYKARTISHPFTDVPEWANAYIAYLYTNKLANGISDTKFGSFDTCSAQMYCTFVLRALGYSDKSDGDFTFKDSLTFAAQKGLADSDLLSNRFTRDNLVAISYQALATKVKGSNVNLLSKLITSGAIDATSAKNISKKIAVYDKTNTASNETSNCNSLEADMTMDMSISMSGVTTTVNGTTSSIKLNISNTSVNAEITLVTTDPTTNQKITVSEWMKDGWVYINDGTNKSKMKMDYSEMLATIRESSAGISSFPIYYFAELTDNGDGNYTITFSPKYLNSVADSLLENSLAVGQQVNFKYNKLSESFKLDQNGIPKNITVIVDMVMTDPKIGNVSTVIKCDMTIISIGKPVTINFPDFSNYTEIKA